MATFTEILPKHKARVTPAMRWTPVDEPSGPTVGFLAIQTDRTGCEYQVDEFPADDRGRGLCLLKLAPGSDATESHYSLFVCGQRATCECKGFVRHEHCKHASAVEACLENGWL